MAPVPFPWQGANAVEEPAHVSVQREPSTFWRRRSRRSVGLGPFRGADMRLGTSHEARHVGCGAAAYGKWHARAVCPNGPAATRSGAAAGTATGEEMMHACMHIYNILYLLVESTGYII